MGLHARARASRAAHGGCAPQRAQCDAPPVRRASSSPRRSRFFFCLPPRASATGCAPSATSSLTELHAVAGGKRGAHRQPVRSGSARRARAIRSDLCAGQKGGERFDRVERRRKPDTHRPGCPARPHHPFEAFQCEREMGAALVAGHGVEFVNDDVADGAQLLAEARGGQQDKKRLRRGDEDVRRPPEHRIALVGGAYRRCAALHARARA